MLAMKIIRLHRHGLMAGPIADRVRKSDRVVRRYLREAEAAGLVEEA